MERKSYYLIILLIALVVCAGVFLYQFNNDVATFMILNETEVAESGSFSGMLMDAYSYGVANQTVSYQTPNHETVNVTTDENGEFKVLDVDGDAVSSSFTLVVLGPQPKRVFTVSVQEPVRKLAGGSMFLLWYPVKKSASGSMFSISVFINGCFYNRLPSLNSDGRESGCPSSVFKKPVLNSPLFSCFFLPPEGFFLSSPVPAPYVFMDQRQLIRRNQMLFNLSSFLYASS